jgi:hypothetical protein
MQVLTAIALAFLLAPLTSNAAAGRSDRVRATAELTCYESAPFWRRVTDRGADDYCRLVDRARARLYSQPEQARKLSEEASRLRAPAVAAHLLHAHAELLLGRAKAAHREFTQVVPALAAPELNGHLTPSAVAAGARAALLSGA